MPGKAYRPEEIVTKLHPAARSYGAATACMRRGWEAAAAAVSSAGGYPEKSVGCSPATFVQPAGVLG